MGSLMKAVIIDEPIACNNLKHMLENYIKQPVHIAGTANDTSEAELLIKQTQPDIDRVFLRNGNNVEIVELKKSFT